MVNYVCRNSVSCTTFLVLPYLIFSHIWTFVLLFLTWNNNLSCFLIVYFKIYLKDNEYGSSWKLYGLFAGWFKSLLPKSALTVEEEAWNAYPYTKTRYTCPFVEKFSLEIETYYYADNGHQENVFGLSGSDLRNRIIGL